MQPSSCRQTPSPRCSFRQGVLQRLKPYRHFDLSLSLLAYSNMSSRTGLELP